MSIGLACTLALTAPEDGVYNVSLLPSNSSLEVRAVQYCIVPLHATMIRSPFVLLAIYGKHIQWLNRFACMQQVEHHFDVQPFNTICLLAAWQPQSLGCCYAGVWVASEHCCSKRHSNCGLWCATADTHTRRGAHHQQAAGVQGEHAHVQGKGPHRAFT